MEHSAEALPVQGDRQETLLSGESRIFLTKLSSSVVTLVTIFVLVSLWGMSVMSAQQALVKVIQPEDAKSSKDSDDRPEGNLPIFAKFICNLSF